MGKKSIKLQDSIPTIIVTAEDMTQVWPIESEVNTRSIFIFHEDVTQDELATEQDLVSATYKINARAVMHASTRFWNSKSITHAEHQAMTEPADGLSLTL